VDAYFVISIWQRLNFSHSSLRDLHLERFVGCSIVCVSAAAARTLAHGCDHVLVHVELDQRFVVDVVVVVIVIVVVVLVLSVVIAVGHIHNKLKH
jgi:hypothetical protein